MLLVAPTTNAIVLTELSSSSVPSLHLASLSNSRSRVGACRSSNQISPVVPCAALTIKCSYNPKPNYIKHQITPLFPVFSAIIRQNINMKPRTLFITVSFFVLSIIGSTYSSVPKDPFLGISPEDEKYYKSSDVMKCKDGSKKFTRAQLNDDFCDCSDGTDEPGTSACPAGKFYCHNVGHSPRVLFSSRVNDGICDCCDGSDEYDGKVKCPNTCWEAGKVARDRLKKKIATYQEGVAIRKQEIQKAKLDIVKDEEELSKLKNDEKVLKELVRKLKEHKEEIEKAEEKERLQKEKEERERKEAEEKANKERSFIEEEGTEQEKKESELGEEGNDKYAEPIHDEIGLVDEPSPDQDFMEDTEEEHKDFSSNVQHSDGGADEAEATRNVGKHEESEHKSSVVTEGKEHSVASDSVLEDGDKDASVHEKSKEASESTEGLSKEELGRLVASRWTGEKVEKESGQVASEDHHQEDHEHEELPGYNNDEDDGYASETDEDNNKYEYDEGEDESHEDISEENHDDSTSYKSVSDDESDFSDLSIEGNPSWFEKIQQTVRNIIRSVNFFKTPIDKSEAAQIRKDFEESSSKLSKIQSRISSLSQKLKHDFGPDKEFYSYYGQCFENKQNKYVYKVCPFKQATQQEGYSTTQLGSWEKFEDYRAMIFLNGDKCWNGPDRSMKVKLRCGLKNEVTDVDEPSRCEYEAVLSTPVLCLEQKLKELQDKLEVMNKDRPQKHDEL